MRSIVKHILIGALFLVGLIGLLLFLSFLFSPKNNDEESGMFDAKANGILGEPANTIDMVIIGDSQVFSSVIPLVMWDRYGITCYCCGSRTQQLSYSEQFLHKAFLNQSPKVVVLETGTIFREIPFGKALLRKAEPILPILAYHDRWKSLSGNDFSFSANYSYLDYSKGYSFSTGVAKADLSHYMEQTSDCEPIAAISRSYVEEFKAYCEDRGAELVLLSVPSTVNWDTQKHNAVRQLAEELDLAFIDMNTLRDEIPIDWSRESSDKGDHLNYFGAKKVSSWLGRYMIESGRLVSHKADDAYSAWDEAYAAFMDRIAPSLSQSLSLVPRPTRRFPPRGRIS